MSGLLDSKEEGVPTFVHTTGISILNGDSDRYNDLDDFDKLFQHLDFDKSLFRRMVESLGVRGEVIY